MINNERDGREMVERLLVVELEVPEIEGVLLLLH